MSIPITDNNRTSLTNPVLDNPFELTLGTVILVVFGMFMLLFGLLRFRIQTGELPFNPDSAYGLLLVLCSIQMITLGKTPFGTFHRNWILIILGFSTAILGTGACFIPGFLAGIIPELVGILMITGGFVLFLHLLFSKGRAQEWIRVPGILQHLTFACGFVYLTEILFGLVILFPWFFSGVSASLLSLVFSVSLFYLAWCIQKVSLVYPQKETADQTNSSVSHSKNRLFQVLFLEEVPLSIPVSFLLLLGVIFTECAVLLIPVSQGLYPFSRDSQFGLLMVIMAIQVLALGKTPLGVYKRSWILILIGLVVVSLGIYSCIIPGLLTGWMFFSLGIWNVITGSTGLGKILHPVVRTIQNPPDDLVFPSPAKKKLLRMVIILHLLTILFGINLIIPGLIPGEIVLGNLFILGILLILLAGMVGKVPTTV